MTAPGSVGLATARTYQYMARLSDSPDAPLHGDCETPKVIELVGQQSILLHRLDQWANDTSIDYAPEWGHIGSYRPPRIATAYVSVRCRQCRRCLIARGKLWTARAIDEIAASNRTWFGTLTLRPEAQFHYRIIADKRVSDAGTRWDQLSQDEQFKERIRSISPEITKFLKRLRKNTKASLRYLLVSEAHKSGDPHFHMLLHEHEGFAPKAAIEAAWRLGFSHWRLCDTDKKAAVYACKYLTKSVLTRVRASREYGTAGPRLMTERYVGRSDTLPALARRDQAQRKSPLSKSCKGPLGKKML